MGMSATPEAMPNVVERPPQPQQQSSANQPPAPGQPLRLTLTAAAAAKQITPWLAKGVAIRKHRLRDLNDLDKARAEKKTWVAAYTDLLTKLFDSPAVGEACNDWVGRLLPEYAPLGLVIEQFYEEMDHRLRRLQAVVDHLEDMAVEDVPAAPAGGEHPAGAAAQGGAAPANKKDEPRGSKSLNWARLFPTAEELTGRAAATADDHNEEETAMPAVAAAAPVASSPAAAAPAARPHAGEGKSVHAAPGALPPVVKPVGLLLVHSADEAKAVCEFLGDLAVSPRVLTLADAKPNDPEALMAGATPPAFALVWPHQGDGPKGDQPDAAAAARFQFQLGFLVGRLGLSRVCLIQALGKPTVDGSPVATIMLDAHGGWQLPLARTLKRAGVAVDLNRLC